MYIGVKQRENKHSERMFYLYLCESKRIEGKVTNKQKYLTSVSERSLMDGSYKQVFDSKLATLDETAKEIVDRKVSQMIQSFAV